MLVHQDKSVNQPVKKNQVTGSDISASRVHSHQLNVLNIVCHLVCVCVCVFLWSVRWSEERRLKNKKKRNRTNTDESKVPSQHNSGRRGGIVCEEKPTLLN